MKSTTKRILFALCAGLIVLVFSCNDLFNLQLPEKIVVASSDAKFSLPAGNFRMEMSKYLNAAELQKNIGTDVPFTVYDYNPHAQTGGVQQFIIYYPLTQIDLDIAKYLDKELDLDNAVSKELTQEFSIPSGNDLKNTQSVDLPDINSAIISKVTWDFSLSPLYEVDGNIPVSKISVELPVSFSKMTFKDGATFDITLADDGGTFSNRFSVEVSDVALLDSSGKTLASATGTAKVSSSSADTISIPLSGTNYISSTMRLSFSLTGSGASSEMKSITLKLSAGLSEGARIKTVEGITMSATDLGDNGKIPVSEFTVSLDALSSKVENVTIKTGSIDVSAVLPSGWSGVEASGSNIVLNGAIPISDNDWKNVRAPSANYLLNKTTDLAQKKVDITQDLNVSGSMSLTLNNATLSFGDSDNATITCAFNIQEAESATLLLNGLISQPMSYDSSFDFPDDVKNYLESATLTNLSITGTVTTTLPTESLYATIDVSSTELKIQNMNKTINIAQGDELTLQTDEGWEKKITPSKDSGISFKTNVTLSACDSELEASGYDPNKLIVTSVKFGETYSVTFDLDFSFDYSFVKLKTDGAEGITCGDIDTGLNINQLLEDIMDSDDESDVNYAEILENIKFTGIDLYVYLTRPQTTGDILDGLSFTIKELTANDVDISPNDSDAPPNFITESTTFESLAKDNTITSTKMFEDGNYSLKTSALCDILNGRPAELKLNYKLVLGGDSIIINKTDLSDQSADNAIKVYLALVVPMKLEITEDIEIKDFMEFVGNPFEEDILNRDDDWDEDKVEDITKYLDLIKNIKCQYTFKNNLGLNMSAEMIAKDKDEEVIIEKEMSFDNKTHTFSLTSGEDGEIRKILETNPFIPTISVTMKEGTFAIPRNGELSMNMQLSVETDGEYELWSK